MTVVFDPVFGPEPVAHGNGDVMERPPINIVFWGKFWQGSNPDDPTQFNSANSPFAQLVIDTTQTLIHSSYLNVIEQYGADPFNMFINDTAWDPSEPVDQGFDAGKIDDIVHHQIDIGRFPAPDDQKDQFGNHRAPIYIVVTPPNINSSQADAAAFNFVGDDDAADIWVGIHGTNGDNTVNPDKYSKAAGHEIGELMSDFNQNGFEVDSPQKWKDIDGPGDNQIGDKEGSAYTFKLSDSSGQPSVRVQPLWSNDDQKWVVTDGTAQTLELKPGAWDTSIKGNPQFSGKFDLVVNGDQWLDINDQVTLGGTPSGGVVLNLNSEIYNFDPNYLSSITLNLKAGLNTVTLTSPLPAGVGLSMNGASPFGGSIILHGPDNTPAIWNITGADIGNFATPGSSGTFSDVETILGGNGNDHFNFLPGGSLSGSIDGGAGFNVLDFSHFLDAFHPDPVGVNLQTHTATPIAHTFANIGSIIGTSASDTLTGPSTDWSINALNSGSVGAVSFSSFENLVGGAGDDSFNFQTTGVITGVIDGGPGNNTLDFSPSANAIFLNIDNHTASTVHSFTNINRVFGSSSLSFDQLIGPAGGAVWTLSGPDSGSVGGISYASFEIPEGNAGNDTFAFQPGATVSGYIDGGGGTNTLDYSALPGPIFVNFTTFRASQTAFGFDNIQNVIGSQSGSDTITGPDADWSISGPNSGSVNGITFSSFENLTGSPATDNFNFLPGGSISGNLDGGAGANTLNYSNRSDPITLNFAGNTATGIGGTFANIGGFVGGSGQNNIVGPSTATTWTVSGHNTVTALGLTFNNFPSITGGPGNDTFAFLTGGSLSGKIDGGGGNDTLNYSRFTGNVIVNLPLGTATNIAGGILHIQNATAGIGNCLLVGDANANLLTGGTGRSILIGEAGADVLTGGSGDNILIGGSTMWDTNAAALSGIFAEWTRTDLSFEQRVSHLLSASSNGLNGAYGLDKKSVFADSSVDLLIGSNGLDWFIESKNDTLDGRTAGDHITTV